MSSLVMRRRRAGLAGRRFSTGGGAPLNIVFEGDSITWGQYAGITTPWPTLAMSALAAPTATYSNVAQNGANIANLVSAEATDNALLDATKNNVLFVFAGTNDIVFSHDGPAAKVALKSYCETMRAAGWVIICATGISRGDGTPSCDPDMTAYAAAIRADSSFYDYLCDFNADPRFDEGSFNDATYYGVSPVHPIQAGQDALAEIALPIIQEAMTYTSTATSVVISPSTAEVPTDGQQQFVASVLDQNGKKILGVTIAWSTDNGSIDSTGLLTAGSSAVTGKTVTATYGALSDTASFDVTAPQFPATIASKFVWLDAFQETVYATTDPVDTMHDFAGSSRSATGSGSARCTWVASAYNGKPTFRFNDSLMEFAADIFAGLTEGELFVLNKHLQAANTGKGGLSAFGATGEEWMPYVDDNIYSNFGSTAQHGPGTPPVTLESGLCLVNIISTASEFTIRVNGVQIFTEGTNTVGFRSVARIGKNTSGVFLHGDVPELFISSAKVSAGNRSGFESYVQTKYGLTF